MFDLSGRLYGGSSKGKKGLGVVVHNRNVFDILVLGFGNIYVHETRQCRRLRYESAKDACLLDCISLQHHSRGMSSNRR